jgi:hypothetical protein
LIHIMYLERGGCEEARKQVTPICVDKDSSPRLLSVCTSTHRASEELTKR